MQIYTKSFEATSNDKKKPVPLGFVFRDMEE